MRELKFRAWSEETKSFEFFDLYEGTECGLTNLQIWARNNSIEQYTGLKDKNGKEICDGDIINAKVKGAWESGSVAYLGFLEWKLRAYWDEARYAFMWHILGSKTQPDRVYDFYDDRVTEIEVIGNIHENPELLEGKK